MIAGKVKQTRKKINIKSESEQRVRDTVEHVISENYGENTTSQQLLAESTLVLTKYFQLPFLVFHFVSYQLALDCLQVKWCLVYTSQRYDCIIRYEYHYLQE